MKTRLSKQQQMGGGNSAIGGGLAACVLLLALFAAGPARAQTVQVSCKTMNAENIAGGTANSAGYTTGTNIAADGTLSVNNQTLPLPPNGVICVKSITCATSTRTLRFDRNPANTPVYLLVEGNVTLGSTNCGIDVGGAASATYYGIGVDRLGGRGGPGGSDGGSCDFTFSATKRAGEGIGPGGGKATVGAAGGGGASPINSGSAGFGGGAAGGQSYSAFDHRILHGGSGGGCGSNAAQTLWQAGGGGGGVLVLASGGIVNLSGSNSFLRARGGAAVTNGGGGGGGVVRVVASTIQGSGTINVDGSGGGTCGTSTVAGGCGGYGLIKLEGNEVNGTFINNSSPQAAIHYGIPQEIFPPAAQKPTLAVTSVQATWNGVPGSLAPAQLNFTEHVHKSPGVYLEAPLAPQQVITVTLASNNVPATATVNVRMNAVGTPSQQAQATTTGAGSGALTWTAQLTVPGDMELGTIEAWIDNVCTPGTAGCDAQGQ